MSFLLSAVLAAETLAFLAFLAKTLRDLQALRGASLGRSAELERLERLLAEDGPLLRLEWLADIPCATIVAGDPLAVSLWLHQVRDGEMVSVRV